MRLKNTSKLNKYKFIIKTAIRNVLNYLMIFTSRIIYYNIRPNENNILFLSWGGHSYSCNPKALSEYINNKYPNKFIIWGFWKPDAHETPLYVKKIKIRTLEYYKYYYKSKYIFTNQRLNYYYLPFKSKEQVYINLTHGGCAIKKVEGDITEALDKRYVRIAQKDSKMLDYSVSNSLFFSKQLRNSFWFKGTIIQSGLPRNDLFFSNKRLLYKERICKLYGIKIDTKLLIYTPTFRNNHDRSCYGFNPDIIYDALIKKFGYDWKIMISSHPNMKSFYKEIYNFNNDHLIDVGEYGDIQELLYISDILITDYSGCIIDFSIQKKPAFLLIKDLGRYDRGTYFNMKELPFPFSDSDDELCRNILNFNEAEYITKLQDFHINYLKTYDSGNSCKIICKTLFENKSNINPQCNEE